MPKVITIIDDKYFNALRNGGDFSLNTGEFSANLNGNVMERVRKTTQLEIEWYSQASVTDVFNFFSSGVVGRDIGSFTADGFKVGHTFDWVDVRGSSPTVEFTGTILTISTDGQTMTYSVDSGTEPSGDQDTGLAWARADLPQNYLLALVYKFGLIDNGASPNYNNAASLTEQRYFADDVGVDSGGRDTNFVNASPQGAVQDWVTGNMQVRFVSNDTYHQVFEIRHNRFVLNPWYLETELENLQNGNSPERMLGNATLKYIFDVDFRQTLSDPNTGINLAYDQSLGNVGWFNENGNGFTSDYEVESITYLDPDSLQTVNGLRVDKKTTVRIEVSRLSGAFVASESAMAFVSYLPSSDQYTGTLTTMLTNFAYSSIRMTEGAGDTLQTAIINRGACSLSGSNMVIEFDVEYPIELAQEIDGGNYIVAVQVEDATKTAQNSDRVMLLSDVREYTQLDALNLAAQWLPFKFVDHKTTALSGEFVSSIFTWNNDGIVVEFFFDIDLNKSTVVNEVTLNVVARDENTNETFQLDSYQFDLSSTITSGGVQQLTIDDTRGYTLIAGDQFNWAIMQVGVNASGVQSYFGAIGQKIPWQDWLRNLNADTSFLDPSAENQGLNFKSSNYSRINDYVINMEGVLNISTVNDIGTTVTGDVKAFSDEIVVSDYTKDQLNNPAKWTQVVEFFHPSTMSNLGGSILKDEPTLMRVTHTFTDGAIAALGDIYCIHMMEVSNDPSKGINELSSIRPYPAGNYLVPKDTFSFLDVYLDSGNVVSECLIDNTVLPAGVNSFNFEFRIQR